jgi:HSP20 family protein
MTTMSRLRSPMADLHMATSQLERMFDTAWVPAVDVSENGDQVEVSLELPGVKPEDLKITMENNVLTIAGQKKQQAFERSFTVPNTIDADRIGARMELGVLYLTLPKAERAKPRQIQVQVQA